MPESPVDPDSPVASDTRDTPDGSDVLDPAVAQRIRWTADGLVCAVVQQHDTGEVLMVGWMNPTALARTLGTGRVTYWSRSRGEYWRKGDTSGHHQYVKSVAVDCDADVLLVRVDQVGAACHTGTRTCFDGRELAAVVGHAPADATATTATATADRRVTS